MLLVLAGCCSVVYADEAPVSSDTVTRALIEDTRRTQTQRLNALDKDCERKFAVTRCLDQVRTERLEMEGRLNRQETVLNDAQRLERAREQKERSQEKLAAHAQKLAKLTSEPPPPVKQPKLAAQPTSPGRNTALNADKEPALSAQERSARAQDYQRKQADAAAKRAEVAMRLKDAGAKKPSLPKPD